MGSLCGSRRSPGARPPGTNKSGLRKITDDVLMDTGLKQKDADYYSRLPGRAAAAQAEQERLRERRSRDRRRERAATATTDTTTETVTPVTPTAPTTPTQPTAPTTPTPPPAPPPFTETVDTGADTTYKGGDVGVGDVIDNRVVTSETEADAIESTGKGRVSTIATSAKGLLGTGAAGTVRRRRSLMGGGLIR